MAMNPPTVRHRFIRSGAFDLRRKVLIKNFLRKQKTYAEMFEEENLENSFDNNPSEVCNDGTLSPQLEEQTYSNSEESDAGKDSSTDMEVDMEVEESAKSIGWLENSEDPCDENVEVADESNKNWRRDKRNISFRKKRKRNRDENSRVNKQDDSAENDAQMDCNWAPFLGVKSTAEAVNGGSETNSNTTLFRSILKRGLSLKRPYSFSNKTQVSEDSTGSDTACNRVTRSMLIKLKEKSSKKRWKKLRMMLLKGYSHTNRLKSTKKKCFPKSLLKPKQSQSLPPENTYSKPECHADALKTNRSVCVQTELTCLPDAINLFSASNTHRSKRPKLDGIYPASHDNSYFLRSCPSRNFDYSYPPSNPETYSALNGTNSPHYNYRSDLNKHKLTRSRSIQENRVSNHVSACRRVRSVYVPNRDISHLKPHLVRDGFKKLPLRNSMAALNIPVY